MVGRIDPERFPALADYVERLPAGLASYPEAQSMGILLKSSVVGHYFHPTWKDLPVQITELFRKPPLPTAWVPTVLNDAIFSLVADTFYPTEDALMKWSYERTIRLAALPMYVPLTKMAGVDRFMRAAARVHDLFQRGTQLEVEARPGSADLRLRHPPHLHSRKNHLTNEAVFRAVLESAGGTGATVKLVESRADGARYHAEWDP